jgi:hypothetical protein|nr:hypothetical protein [Kofleriaceae bacterium]
MKRLLFAVAIVAVTASAARADQAADLKARDVLRLAVGDAIDHHDAKAFGKLVAGSLKTTTLWFDTAACRKRFSDATVAAADLPALVDCLAPLGMDASHLLVKYGPDVVVRLGMAVAGGKATLTSLTGDISFVSADRERPDVYLDSFEKHRTAGSKAIVFDQAARAELQAIPETGAIFRVCVDTTGKVASTEVAEVDDSGPTATQIAAATAAWRFSPFTLAGKPIAACTTETVKLK